MKTPFNLQTGKQNRGFRGWTRMGNLEIRVHPRHPRSIFSGISALLLLALLAPLCSAEDAREGTVRAADDARIAAMKAPDREQLTAIFSDDLHYAHSSGTVDTKALFIDALTAGRSRYVGYDHEERKFTFPSPGVALMTGRARVQVANATGGMNATLSYLAVWREEGGQWRFLAWQSCRLPPPPGK